MKLTFRELRVEDAEISWKWRNDPEIWKLTQRKWDNYVTKETEEEWIKKILQEKDSRRFAICVGEDQKYIGNIQLTDINEDSAHCGIFIGDKEYWGKGIAKTATQFALDYAKVNLHVKKVIAVVKKKHRNALAVLEKLGFEFLEDDNAENYRMTYSIQPNRSIKGSSHERLFHGP